jgi:hypothetical protein
LNPLGTPNPIKEHACRSSFGLTVLIAHFLKTRFSFAANRNILINITAYHQHLLSAFDTVAFGLDYDKLSYELPSSKPRLLSLYYERRWNAHVTFRRLIILIVIIFRRPPHARRQHIWLWYGLYSENYLKPNQLSGSSK